VGVLAGVVWLAGAGHADAPVPVRPLTQTEADVRKVGLCDWDCSTTTIACPTTTSMKDWCAWPPGFNTTRARCDGATKYHGGCWACSANVNYRICQKVPKANCTPQNSAGQTCGFMKRADCNWTGTACVCPGLPAAFSTDGCLARDCTSP